MFSSKARAFTAVAVLCGVTLSVFAPVALGGFLHWDDNHNVVFNERVHALTGGSLAWMWSDVGPDLRYKPIGWLAWAMIATLFGVDPFGFHLANLAVHALNTVLVWRLLTRLGGFIGAERRPCLTGWAVVGALLWAIHPMRVEPVAWISCLPHHLALCFTLMGVMAYLGLDFSRPAWIQGRFWSAVAFQCAALASFPLPLGIPAVWLALNLYPLRRIRPSSMSDGFGGQARRAWMEICIVTAVALVFLGLQLWFRHEATGHFSPPPSLERFPVGERIMQGLYVWTFYFWRFFFHCTSPRFISIYFPSRR